MLKEALAQCNSSQSPNVGWNGSECDSSKHKPGQCRNKHIEHVETQ